MSGPIVARSTALNELTEIVGKRLHEQAGGAVGGQPIAVARDWVRIAGRLRRQTGAPSTVRSCNTLGCLDSR